MARKGTSLAVLALLAAGAGAVLIAARNQRRSPPMHRREAIPPRPNAFQRDPASETTWRTIAAARSDIRAPRTVAGLGERKPTQDRSREEHQLDPNGVLRGGSSIDDAAGPDQRDVAITPGEAIRAFGTKS